MCVCVRTRDSYFSSSSCSFCKVFNTASRVVANPDTYGEIFVTIVISLLEKQYNELSSTLGTFSLMTVIISPSTCSDSTSSALMSSETKKQSRTHINYSMMWLSLYQEYVVRNTLPVLCNLGLRYVYFSITKSIEMFL